MAPPVPAVSPGAPHGLVGDYEQAFNDDLLNFLRG